MRAPQHFRFPALAETKTHFEQQNITKEWQKYIKLVDDNILFAGFNEQDCKEEGIRIYDLFLLLLPWSNFFSILIQSVFRPNSYLF